MSAAEPTRVDILLPDLGWPAVDVTVWFARPGDRVYQGDRIVEVAGAGVTFDVAAPNSGTLIEQTVSPRERVTTGQRLGTMLADPEHE